MAKQTKEVATIDFTKFDVAQLPELKGKKDEIASVIEANPIVEIVDNSTYELAKKSRTAVKTLRTSLEKEKKEVNDRIKKNVLEVVSNEYDSLISGVKQSEFLRQEKVDDWEEKKEKERQEKLRLEQERIDGIKNSISEFGEVWEKAFSLIRFENIDECLKTFNESVDAVNASVFQEYEVLFTDKVSYLRNLLDVKIHTLHEQEQIRIDNLLIEEKNAEQSRIQEWQRTWNANIDTLSFDDIPDVKSVLVKSKLANLKHYSASYEEIFVSTEKRLHSQIELISKAEEQRIAQEKFLREKREFEEKQAKQDAEIKKQQNEQFEIRKNRLSEIGFVWIGHIQDFVNKELGLVLDGDLIANVDANNFEQRLSNAKKLVADAKKQKESVVETTQEVEFEEDANYHEDDVHEVATKGLSTRLKASDLPSEMTEKIEETTWQSIYQDFEEETGYDEYNSSELFVSWLSENYNVPTPKN